MNEPTSIDIDGFALAARVHVVDDNGNNRKKMRMSEHLSSLDWIAFAIIAVGMYLVEPKASDEELVIKRSFEE